MKRCIALTGIALVAFAPTADAVPKKEKLTVERQVVRTVEGDGCTTGTVTVTFRHPPIDVWPDQGERLEGSSYVVAVTRAGRQVTWTVGPNAETCAARTDDEWYWTTGDASFSAAYRDRLYVVRATRRDGIRSIAGLRTRWGRQGPSIGNAKRRFGRPSSIRGSRYGTDICHADWAPLGLRVLFANFGGARACRSGWFQTARISGSRADEWAVVIDGSLTSPAVVGTSLRYLREEGLARYNYFNEAWALSQDWLPYGEAGYYGTVSARLAYDDDFDGANPVRGFDLYVGAAGD